MTDSFEFVRVAILLFITIQQRNANLSAIPERVNGLANRRRDERLTESMNIPVRTEEWEQAGKVEEHNSPRVDGGEKVLPINSSRRRVNQWKTGGGERSPLSQEEEGEKKNRGRRHSSKRAR